MKTKYKKLNFIIKEQMVDKYFFVYNGKFFIKVKVKPFIIGKKFNCFVKTKKISK